MDPKHVRHDAGLEELRVTIHSLGWTKVIEPTMARMVETDANTLCSLKRPEGVTDDFLRGRIEAFRILREYFHKVVANYDAERFSEAAKQAQAAQPPAGSPFAPTHDPDNPAS